MIVEDPFDTRIALGATGLLQAFNVAGVLSAADVHVAQRLGRLVGEHDEAALLAAAFAARAPRLAHVRVDLATVRERVAVDTDLPVDVGALPWPAGWVDSVAASPLVAGGGPLHLDGTRLYLDRYWREERQVASDLRARAALDAPDVDEDSLATGLTELFGTEADDHQRLAAATAVSRRLAVVAGGPGTGKTTTVARVLALLHQQALSAGQPAPLVALAAPTGKAAARLEEAVHGEAHRLHVSDEAKAWLLGLSAVTLHRLLGWQPANRARFRHDRSNRLPHGVVVVDETSMVALTLMARLLEAVRPAARLVLVGDPDQLASVEAGAVLGDIVAGAAVADSIVVLRKVHRFGGAIAELAEAVQRGDAGGATDVLTGDHPDVAWLPVDVAVAGRAALTPVRDAVVDAGGRVAEAAALGRGRDALAALGSFRLLCAHRRGPYGVSAWIGHVERWLDLAGAGGWYAGRPLLVTENDYGLGLYNGDSGVVVAHGDDGGVRAVFERRGQLLELTPQRLPPVETVYAMTVHKAQGSQFDEVAVLLPDAGSPILTRELLYTAITRARRRLILVGTEETVRGAVARPITRASGLREALSLR